MKNQFPMSHAYLKFTTDGGKTWRELRDTADTDTYLTKLSHAASVRVCMATGEWWDIECGKRISGGLFTPAAEPERDYDFVARLSAAEARHYANAKLEQLRDRIYDLQCKLRDNTLPDAKAARTAARELHEQMGAIRTVMGIVADKMKPEVR